MPSISFTGMSGYDNSDDSLRKLTDDFGRHRLTDLLEVEEREEDVLDYLRPSSRRKRYSSIGSTASSMDGLWDLHPRRLSEAGHSDSSAVLTEDTDSFIIGQRVWVGGTKPGTIAYIGETQFAPGEWAGIALDEPIGKNDGSVAGVKYFQCENKKGVFSRLTRLTRVPLEQPGMGSNETFVTPTNGTRRSPISPTGSTSASLFKSPMSLSNSNTSLASSAATHADFKIGDRVIIKSTQGSKIGTVRYMGLTDFAPGEWVGVELDDPRGKNDGSVEGKRYFECRPNFGLFAPIAKVSKSPSKHKPGACVVHSGPGLPPSGIKRTNSKESMTSLASRTSVASSVRRVRLGVTSLTPKKVLPKTTATPIPTRTALQDVLREKQQHIEQLLKERDLERAEITRAASQADEAEQQFFNLKREFEQYRAECELKVKTNAALLDELKIDRTELLNQLEEEKRKNEDLLFKFEEAAITNTDIEATSENYIRKISELEKILAEERKKSSNLDNVSDNLFEAEENLIKARDDIERLKKELDETKQQSMSFEKDKRSSSEFVELLQKELENVKAENKEKSSVIEKLKEEATDHEKTKREVEESKGQLDENCRSKDAEIEKLIAKLVKTEEMLQEKLQVINKLEDTNAGLIKENDKLKMELSSKTFDLETANDKVAEREQKVNSIMQELEKVKVHLSEKEADLGRYKDNHKVMEESLKQELEETRETLKQQIAEIQNLNKASQMNISLKDQLIDEANKTIAHHKNEISQLSVELADFKKSSEDSTKEIHSRHARQVASQDSQLMALSAEIQQKNEEIMKSQIVITKLEEDLCSKNGIIEKLRLELEQYVGQQTSHVEGSNDLNRQMNELALRNGDMQRQLVQANERIHELIQVKQRLEVEVQTLASKCDNSQQLEQLRKEIYAKEHILEITKSEFSKKIHILEQNTQELELRHQHDLAELNRIRHELETKLQISIQAEQLHQQRCDSSIGELAQVRDQFRVKIGELEHLVHEKGLLLQNLQVKCSESESHYQAQLKAINEEMGRNIQGCHQKISALTQENVNLKEELAKKLEEVIEANAKCSHLGAQAQLKENELKGGYNEKIRQLEFALNEKNVLLEKVNMELQLVKNDCQNTNTDLSEKDKRISELVAEVQRTRVLINNMEEALNNARLLNQQTVQEHEMTQSQCQGLLERVAVLQAQVQNGETCLKNLQVEHNSAVILMTHLRITQQQREQCLHQLQNNGSQNCESLQQLLNQIKIDNNNNQNEEKILVLQREIEIIQNKLGERNHQFEAQQAELLKLQEELLKARESPKCKDGNQDILDKELAENQIKFLNSIIVDIQKKNEEQKARIEILESGYSPAMVDDLKLTEQTHQRQFPPRLYCDICEEFDLHETEDCPKQNSDLAAVNAQRGLNPQAERAYCEICEVFGHATEDCQEDETF